MKTKNDYCFLDELKHFTIHREDFLKLPVNIQKVLTQHENIEFYPEGKQNGKIVNKIDELFKHVKRLKMARKKNNDIESNEECMEIDVIIELLKKMTAKDWRKIKIKRKK